MSPIVVGEYTIERGDAGALVAVHSSGEVAAEMGENGWIDTCGSGAPPYLVKAMLAVHDDASERTVAGSIAEALTSMAAKPSAELERIDRVLAWLVGIKAEVEFGKSDLHFFDPLDGGDSFVEAPHNGTGPDIRRAFVGMCESSPGFDAVPETKP